MTLRTLFLAAVGLAVSTTLVQAADLYHEPRTGPHVSHRHHWIYRHPPVRQALVAGVRGATPLTVPFYARGWYPGPTYYYGWRRPVCCGAARAAISVRG
jgi:hypothetical protein